MFNTAFNDFIPPAKASLDYYPANLQAEIDDLNEWIYPNINSTLRSIAYPIPFQGHIVHADGVYRAGFASTQEAYEEAVQNIFEALDKVEKLITGKDYLVGNQLTEADVRLWVTIVRCFFVIARFVLTVAIDSIRSCLCRTLQMQHSYHSRWLSCDSHV